MQCIETVLRNFVEHLLAGRGGLYDGQSEASFEAKTSEEGIAGDGNRRSVLGVGGRSVRIDRRIDNGYTVSEYLAAS
jgi:hypothetical protein